jgi:ABC-2 type transport system permease protein
MERHLRVGGHAALHRGMTATLSLFTAFLRRDWAIARSYRLSFGLGFVDSLVSLVLFFYLGHLIDQTELSAQSQLSAGYFAFAIVGYALIDILRTGVTTFAAQLRQDQVTGTLEALLVTPAPQSLVVLGSASFEILKAIISSVVMIVLAVLFFGLDLSLDGPSAVALIVAVPASFALFTALGIVVAGLTVVVKQTVTLVQFLMTGLSVLAGVYFPISVLPQPLETIAKLLPFTWALDVFRAALLGGDVSTTKVVLLVGCAGLTLPLSIALFGFAVDYAKRQGSLAQY